MSEPIKPNLILPSFIARIEQEIQANQKKGDWRTWKPQPVHLISEMQWHMHKLTCAMHGVDHNNGNTLGDKTAEKVSEYAADIAAYAQKAHELYGMHPKE